MISSYFSVMLYGLQFAHSCPWLLHLPLNSFPSRWHFSRIVLERVSRTTSEILKVFVRGFSGKDLDLQPQRAVLLREWRKILSIYCSTNSLLIRPLAASRSASLEHPADGVDVLFEVGGGVPLSFQLRQFPLGLLQLPFALFVHGKEVPVRELPHGVEGEQLLFLFSTISTVCRSSAIRLERSCS